MLPVASLHFSLILLLKFLISTAQGRLCPDPQCPPYEGGNRTILLPSSDCITFYSCVWGFPTLLTCPPGLRFNPFIPGCVPEDMADCSACEELVEDVPESPEPAETINDEENLDQQPKTLDKILRYINYNPFLN